MLGSDAAGGIAGGGTWVSGYVGVRRDSGCGGRARGRIVGAAGRKDMAESCAVALDNADWYASGGRGEVGRKVSFEPTCVVKWIGGGGVANGAMYTYIYIWPNPQMPMSALVPFWGGSVFFHPSVLFSFRVFKCFFVHSILISSSAHLSVFLGLSSVSTALFGLSSALWWPRGAPT